MLIQRKVTKEFFTILLATKVSKTVLFFGRIFLFSAHFSPPNKTADSKIPRSARARPSIFSRLYLRKIKVLALKSLRVGLYAMLFRLAQGHFKISRKNQILSNVLECAKIVRAVREALSKNRLDTTMILARF